MTNKWNERGFLDWVNGDVLNVSDLEDTLRAGCVPIGSVVAWLKTYAQKNTGSNSGTSTNCLIDSSATFQTDGITKDMIVYNQTDNTWSYVISVDSETQLTLNDDIFTATGKTYFIYATPRLPDGFVECNGQVLSDSDSPYDGQTIPNLNSGTYRMLRGATSSGGTGGSDTHTLTVDEIPAHHHTVSGRSGGYSTPGGTIFFVNSTATIESKQTGDTGGGAAHNNLPAYYEVVWIMRVK